VNPFLFITDLDHTLVGDDLAMADLNRQLEHHRQQFGTKIVYSTGRSPLLYQQLRTEKSLLEPDSLVLSVGTQIYHNGTLDATWSAKLAQGWSRDGAIAAASHFTDLTPQPDSEQSDFKVSYYLTEQAAIAVLPQLAASLQARGIDAQVIFSGGKDLDILPRQANKGMAMTYVRQHLGFDPADTVACGDSGNDLALFVDRPERGIIVGNARPELLQWHHANPSSTRYLATAHCAAGILEGMRYFRLITA